MNILSLKGKGLFIFSDPGGAKPVLALCQSLQADLDAFKVISDRVYDFFEDFAIDVNKADFSPVTVLTEFTPNFIFTGTSYTSSIELEYIKAARELSIPSYSYVDHWTSKIIVFGNPYHQYLKQWKPSISRAEILKSLGIGNTIKKLILYAPDPLLNAGNLSKFGFDELQATKALIAALKQNAIVCNLVCNLHPNQNPDKLLPMLKNEMIIVPKGTHLNTLIYHADVVIGFFSNLLIESAVLDKPVLRFFLKEGLYDPLAHMGVGTIVYPKTIVQELKAIL